MPFVTHTLTLHIYMLHVSLCLCEYLSTTLLTLREVDFDRRNDCCLYTLSFLLGFFRRTPGQFVSGFANITACFQTPPH